MKWWRRWCIEATCALRRHRWVNFRAVRLGVPLRERRECAVRRGIGAADRRTVAGLPDQLSVTLANRAALTDFA
jgi:hypothetical protein